MKVEMYTFIYLVVKKQRNKVLTSYLIKNAVSNTTFMNFAA